MFDIKYILTIVLNEQRKQLPVLAFKKLLCLIMMQTHKSLIVENMT